MDPTPHRPDDDDDATETARDVLSGFNAEEILDDPVATEPHEQKDAPPAATPDSPNPI